MTLIEDGANLVGTGINARRYYLEYRTKVIPVLAILFFALLVFGAKIQMLAGVGLEETFTALLLLLSVERLASSHYRRHGLLKTSAAVDKSRKRWIRILVVLLIAFILAALVVWAGALYGNLGLEAYWMLFASAAVLAIDVWSERE